MSCGSTYENAVPTENVRMSTPSMTAWSVAAAESEKKQLDDGAPGACQQTL